MKYLLLTLLLVGCGVAETSSELKSSSCNSDNGYAWYKDECIKLEDFDHESVRGTCIPNIFTDELVCIPLEEDED